MIDLPNIIISSLDLARLNHLIDILPKDSQPELDNLRYELDRAIVTAPENIPATVVTMNSTIRFIIEPTGKTFELTLSYPEDALGKPDRISVLAPVGSALLGLAVGQQIEWTVPGDNTIKVQVLDVSYQPENSGEYTT
ncbi:Regulator of nucleoside diphosphate kinase [Candidatus Nitrotoga sp. HW29]|uniref:nucleoside diphosphate kinase regulator n=1 Tax=Candidatus Nitrotoga sp. HW29 TaxID=2886963 RepID=UPI001EF28B51|nr:nucleoside diphosphate kinase regulator [Candidatus Nitrotoga sp. HW29]CAH1904587.1 Regulator of nucleoside diphosphate kinase [Candidatus Nitrotoga sp. HW29]